MVDTEWSEEDKINVGLYQLSILSHFLFTLDDNVTKLTKDGAVNKMLYSYDLILLTETIIRCKNKMWI